MFNTKIRWTCLWIEITSSGQIRINLRPAKARSPLHFQTHCQLPDSGSKLCKGRRMKLHKMQWRNSNRRHRWRPREVGGRRGNQTFSARCFGKAFSLAPSASHTSSAECRATLHIESHRPQNHQLKLTSLHKYFASFFSSISKVSCKLVRRPLRTLLLSYLMQLSMVFCDHPSTRIICCSIPWLDTKQLFSILTTNERLFCIITSAGKFLLAVNERHTRNPIAPTTETTLDSPSTLLTDPVRQSNRTRHRRSCSVNCSFTHATTWQMTTVELKFTQNNIKHPHRRRKKELHFCYSYQTIKMPACKALVVVTSCSW